MTTPTPLQSFIGGLSLPIPVHSLMLLNGNVFGISGFLHRAVKGNIEAAAGVAGLILGGAFVATLDGQAPAALLSPLSHVAISGFLVGLGTKLANGCTSGHMICGLSRFSLRSLAATMTFFTTGVITAHLFHSDLPAAGPMDWSLGDSGLKYLLAQALPLAASLLLYTMAPQTRTESVPPSTGNQTEQAELLQTTADDTCGRPEDAATIPPNHLARTLGFLTSGIQFGLGLQLSNLTDPLRVLAFLLLPFHRAFDPSLAFLAAGALPLSIFLYHRCRGSEKPRLGGKWGIPQGGQIDFRLLAGAATFGIGWGLVGVCPGPGLVNFGRAIVGGKNVTQFAVYLATMLAGGLLV